MLKYTNVYYSYADIYSLYYKYTLFPIISHFFDLIFVTLGAPPKHRRATHTDTLVIDQLAEMDFGSAKKQNKKTLRC